MEDLKSVGALSELPFPLAPVPSQPGSSLEVIARNSNFYLPSRAGGQQAGLEERSALVRLYTQETTGLPARLWRAFIKERGLVHFHHGIYREPQEEPTPLIRAASLGLLTPAGYHHRIRYSRTTAAWVLGYLPDLPQGRLHVDYDRDRRCNLPRPYRASFASHQAQLRPYETMTLGPIHLTTALKTALDIITHCLDEEDLDIVKAILVSSQNSVTPELLLQTAREQANLKSTALLRAQHLAHQLKAAAAGA